MYSFSIYVYSVRFRPNQRKTNTQIVNIVKKHLFISGKEEASVMTGHVMCCDGGVVEGVSGERASPDWKCEWDTQLWEQSASTEYSCQIVSLMMKWWRKTNQNDDSNIQTNSISYPCAQQRQVSITPICHVTKCLTQSCMWCYMLQTVRTGEGERILSGRGGGSWQTSKTVVAPLLVLCKKSVLR